MEKVVEMGKTSATGSFQLLVGVAASTIIMAVGAIILGRLLTTDEYGLYGIVVVPSMLIILFRDWGVNSAMTKYIANFRASEEDEEIGDFIVAGFIFEVASGLVLSFLSLFLASFIASTVFHRPESSFYIAIVSVSIISGSLLTASQSCFVGFERMELNTFTLVCQAVIKTAVGPSLVLLGFSVLGAVYGYIAGFIAAGIIGLATFYFMLFRPLRKKQTKNSNLAKTLKKMLNYGVPLSIGFIISNVQVQIYAFIVIPFTTNAIYGNFQTAINFALLLTFFTTPIATVLLPAFAKLDPENERELLKTVFTSSVKYTSILVVPATMALMALSGPMIGALFGEKYVYGPFFLTLYVVSNLLAVVGSLSVTGLLSGLGETNILMKQSIITLIIGIPLSLLLIPTLGITGLLLTTIFDGVPSLIWVLRWVWRRHGAKPDFQSSARILTASTLAAIPAYVTATFLNKAFEHTVGYYVWPTLKETVRHKALLFHAHAGQILVKYTTVQAYVPWIELALGLILFLAIYVLGAPIIGAVSLDDINNLRTMFAGMGVVSKIINLPLNIAEKAAQTKNQNKKAHKKS